VADDDVAGEQRPDPAGAAARSMAQLAQQMKDMADRMMGAGMPGWPVPGQAAAARRAVEGAASGKPAVPESSASGGGGSGRSGMPGMPPMPATMSARQMQAIVDDVGARRAQVQALVTQLTLFDEQLATFETSLQPLLQWLTTWSDLEGAVTDFWTPKPPRSS
jgi:hypothetical protein